MVKSNGFRFAENVPGKERIKVLLAARGYTVTRFARAHGYNPTEVSMTLSGARPYPEIRDAIAAELGLSRAEIDRLIDEPGKTGAADADGESKKAA